MQYGVTLDVYGSDFAYMRSEPPAATHDPVFLPTTPTLHYSTLFPYTTLFRSPTPAARKSWAVTTICWADFTRSPDNPMASGLCSWQAAMSVSGGTLMPRLMTR